MNCYCSCCCWKKNILGIVFPRRGRSERVVEVLEVLLRHRRRGGSYVVENKRAVWHANHLAGLKQSLLNTTRVRIFRSITFSGDVWDGTSTKSTTVTFVRATRYERFNFNCSQWPTKSSLPSRSEDNCSISLGLYFRIFYQLRPGFVRT